MKTLKTLFLLSFISIFITSCGSDKKNSYKISDDHNGTKSPRIKNVIERTADNNKSKETITKYTYNKDNLLILKERSHTQKREYDIIEKATYSYNKQKQLSKRRYSTSSVPSLASNSRTFAYNDILHKETKLPIVLTESTESRGVSCTKTYVYLLDKDNFARTISSIDSVCSYSYTLYSLGVQTTTVTYMYTYDANGNMKSRKSIEKHKDFTNTSTTYFTYTSNNQVKEIMDERRKKVFLYDKNNLLQTVEYYTRDFKHKNYELRSREIYSYENKPYYHKQAPTSLDFYELDFFL